MDANDLTKHKIKQLMLSQVNPLVDKRLKIKELKEIESERKTALLQAERALAEVVAEEQVEFYSLINLIGMSGVNINTGMTNSTLFNVLGVKRTEESVTIATKLVKDLVNQIDQMQTDGAI